MHNQKDIFVWIATHKNGNYSYAEHFYSSYQFNLKPIDQGWEATASEEIQFPVTEGIIKKVAEQLQKKTRPGEKI